VRGFSGRKEMEEYYHVEVRMKDGEVVRATALGRFAAWVCPYCRHQMLAELDSDPGARPTRASHCCKKVFLLHGDRGRLERIGCIEEQ
jgi:hypothetical protein